MILFSHSILLIFPDRQEGIFYLIKFFGTIGVDLFFVLSGYLIGKIIITQIEEGRTSFRNFLYFWVRRWFKTLPNYFLILVLNILLLIVLTRDLPERIGSYFFFLQNIILEMPDFFTESWSLSIEEFSYILGPLILWIFLVTLKTNRKKMFLVLTFLMILLGIAVRYYYHLHHHNTSFEDWSHNLRKVVIYRIDGIYYGFIGAYFTIYVKEFWNRYQLLSLFFGAVAFVLLHLAIYFLALMPDTHPTFYNNYYLPILLISLLAFFPWFSNLQDSNSFIGKQILYISLISYALYLVNYSLILLTIQHFLDITKLDFFQKLLALLIYWLISFGFAHLLYTYFERPVMLLRENRYLKSKFFK